MPSALTATVPCCAPSAEVTVSASPSASVSLASTSITAEVSSSSVAASSAATGAVFTGSAEPIGVSST